MTQLILYTSEDGQAQVQLRADLGTVWLTQLEMAELFNASKQNISLHLKNIYQDRELDPAATVKESLTVQTEGAFKANCHAAFDHFRGVTKMLERDSGSKCEVDHFRGFSTRCVENPLESLTIDPISQFAPTSHQHREDITHGSHS